MMKFKFLLGITLAGTALSIGNNPAMAQCSGWNWPEDKATAEEKNVLYGDYVKAGNYLAAVEPHQWLLDNAPNLNTSLYIKGSKIYESLADKEKDPAKKAEYVAKALLMYDLRVKHCNDEVNVINRKAISAYRYWVNIKEKRPELLQLFETVIEKSGDKTSNGVSRAYANVVKVNKADLSEEEILGKFENITEIIEKNIAKGGKNVASWEKALEFANGVLPTLVNIDCDFVRENYGPRFKENKNIDDAKKIFKYMLASKCTDDPLWTEAAQVIQQEAPDATLALILGKKCLGDGEYECAEKYFNEAIKLTEKPAEKADIYLQLGLAQSKRGRKSTARDYFRKSLALDGSKREAYTYIGNLYFQSYNDCAGKVDKVKDRLVFIAAYNMYQRAGNGKLMTNAKAQFPSKEEIFERNYQKGQSMTVGCWVGESVVLDTRD